MTTKTTKDDYFELYDLKIEVLQDEAKPMICNHPKGMHFLMSGENLIFPNNATFPLYCLASLMPILPVKQRDTHACDWITTDSIIACPDPNCGGLFKITRLGKKSFKHSDVTLTALTNE